MNSPAIDARRDAGDGGATPAPVIGDFLADHRVMVDLEVASRKRLLEQMAKLLAPAQNGDDANADDDPCVDSVLRALIQREKLGSTGIGDGIALPHARIAGLAEPMIAVARLKRAIPYDAQDGAPVWLAVCLLAPAQNGADDNAIHLQLLAALAKRFGAPGFLERLRNAPSAADLAAQFRQ
ncbi:MAG: PTS sugar transporter subunit IIA [bacterium]